MDRDLGKSTFYCYTVLKEVITKKDGNNTGLKKKKEMGKEGMPAPGGGEGFL